MEHQEMKQKIIAMESKGLLKNLSVTFVWGGLRRRYTCSNFRFENGDVHFRQDSVPGDDSFPNNCLSNINEMFTQSLLDNIIRCISVDKNLF